MNKQTFPISRIIAIQLDSIWPDRSIKVQGYGHSIGFELRNKQKPRVGKEDLRSKHGELGRTGLGLHSKRMP